MRPLRKCLFRLRRRELSQRATAHYQARQLPVHNLGTRTAIAVCIAAREARRAASEEILDRASPDPKLPSIYPQRFQKMRGLAQQWRFTTRHLLQAVCFLICVGDASRT